MTFNPLTYFERAERARRDVGPEAELEILQELVSLFQLVEEPTDAYGEALRWTANAYQAMGNLTQAQNYRIEALRIVEQLGENCNPYLVTWVYSDLGRTFIELRDWPRAEEYIRSAIKNHDSGPPDIQGDCMLCLNLGVILMNTGRLDEAVKLGEDVLAKASTLDRPYYILALQNVNIGAVHLQTNRLNDAHRHLRRGLVHAEVARNRALKRKGRKLLGEAYLRAWLETSREDYRREGERMLAQVVIDEELTGDFAAAADAELELVRLAVLTDREDLADFRSAKAINALEKAHIALGYSEFSQAYFGRWANIYDRAVHFQLRNGNKAEAFLTSERSRARLLLARLGNGPGPLGGKASLRRAQRAEIADRYGTAVVSHARLEIENRRRSIRTVGLVDGTTDPPEIQSARVAFTRSIDDEKLLDFHWSSPMMSPASSASEIQKRLSPKDAVISFQTCEDRIITFVLTKTDLHFQDLPMGRDRVKAAVDEVAVWMMRLQRRALQLLRQP